LLGHAFTCFLLCLVAVARPVVAAGDLALGQNATASSTRASQYGPSNAVDGVATTRWVSNWSDPQWISVDLGAVYPVNHVVLSWETAYGKAYEIQVSTDGLNWTTAFSETNGDGGIDDITFSQTYDAQYVRMYGTQRGTSYGYSLYAFEVYGDRTASPVLTSISVSPATASVAVGGTQQFTATGLDQYGNPLSATTVGWAVSGGGTEAHSRRSMN